MRRSDEDEDADEDADEDVDDAFRPLLPQGMSEMVKARPDKPVEWLAKYLLDNDPQKDS